MRTPFIVCLLAFAGISTASAQFSSATDKASMDLQAALDELATVQEQVSEEKLPLAKRFDALEIEAQAKRKQLERLKRLVDNREVSLGQLDERVEKLEESVDFLSNTMDDYVSRFQSQVNIAEEQLYLDVITEAREAHANAKVGKSETFAEQLEVLQASLDRMAEISGGRKFSGKAIVGNEQQEGDFVLLGPVALFSNANTSGLVGLNVVQGLPDINDIGFNSEVKTLVETGSGLAPIDTTLGDALQIQEIEETLLEHIAKGGAVMYPILALLAISILIFLWKLIQIMGTKTPHQQHIDEIVEKVQANDLDGAEAVAKKVGGEGGDLLLEAVKAAKTHADRELTEEILYEKVLGLQPKLEFGISFIAVAAATAPLLGLLGTVTGMIRTFKLITIYGTGDAGSLAGGISEALITTKFGLVVAIPTLIGHAVVSRMARGKIGALERAAVAFLNGLEEKKHDDNKAA